MIAKRRQLYNGIRDLRIIDSVSKYAGIRQVHYQHIPSTCFVRWPDGTPCIPVNMYLLDHACEWRGETPMTYASQLSEFLRYCAKGRKDFGKLVDGDIYRLTERLSCQSRQGTVRNANTIRGISQRVLHFLDWFQRNLYRGAVPLIGEAHEGPAIVCIRATNATSKEAYWHHASAPLPASTRRKPPIPHSVIEDIEAAIDSVAVAEASREPAARRYSSDLLFQSELNSYLYDRRDFMIWMMKRTGLRPSELANMNSVSNGVSIHSGRLMLHTMKRRMEKAPVREFPICEKDVRRVLRYLNSRDRWLRACSKRKGEPINSDAMFLGTAAKRLGERIGISALEKDFQKLCTAAGYSDFQVCFSMFRHRFITDEVRAHIKQWEEEKGAFVVDADYRALFERIKVKTGHANVDSLMHYLHIARETEGLWVPVDDAVEKERRYRDLVSDVTRIKHELTAGLTEQNMRHRLKRALDAMEAMSLPTEHSRKKSEVLHRKERKLN